MWARLSGKRKARQDLDKQDSQSSHGEITSKILQQHLNLSVDSTSQAQFSSPSPPLSPSRNSSDSRRSGNPGSSKKDSLEFDASCVRSGPPKEVITSMAIDMTSAAGRPSGASMDLTQSIFAPSPTSDRATFASTYHSTDSPHSAHFSGYATPVTRPTTPNPNHGSNSVRSILRNPRTPGTGQNVRFFARDAFRVISPNLSIASTYEDCESGAVAESPLDDALLSDPLPAVTGNEEVGPIACESFKAAPHRPPVFSPPAPRTLSGPDPLAATRQSSPLQRSSSELASPRLSNSSLLLPIPPPDVSNLFDISNEHEIPIIPHGIQVPMADGAVELIGEEADESHSHLTSTSFKKGDATWATAQGEPRSCEEDAFFTTNHPTSGQPLERSRTTGAEGTVFHSLVDRTSSESLDRPQSPLMHAQDVEGSPTSRTSRSIRMIGHLSVQPSSKSRRTDARRDITSETRHRADDLPPSDAGHAPTDPGQPAGGHPDVSAADATTYYTPQRKLPTTPPAGCNGPRARGRAKGAEYAGRTSKEDDLVSNLRTQLTLQQEMCSQYEIDIRARDELVDLLGARLEKTEADGQRRKGAMRGWRKKAESLERACRQLQEDVDKSRQDSIERSVMDDASQEALRMLHVRIGELERERGDWRKKEHRLKEKIGRLEDEVKEENEREGSFSDRVVDMHGSALHAQEQHDETTWAAERSELLSRIEQLQGAANELGILKVELEAQWKHMEDATEQIERLGQDKKDLEQTVLGLEDRIGVMEVEWNESENRKMVVESELCEAREVRESAERERDEMREQIRSEREHSVDLTHALQEREDRITSLEEERRYALDNVSRVEEHVRQRDAELADYARRLSERDAALERAHEELSTVRREHARTVERQARELQDIIQRDSETRHDMEEWVKQKAENDVALVTLRERSGALEGEVERLRRQVHELQQESADKEVRIVQLGKQRAQDREDLSGLNIALDSKQQELELLKRRLGVRGTAGSTPAPASKRAQRRDSGILLATSDVESETPRIAALGKSARVNAFSKGERQQLMPLPSTTTSRASIGETLTPKAVRTRVPSTYSHVGGSVRRSVSVSSNASTHSVASTNGDSEKENATVESGYHSARKSMIPMLA